MPDMSTMDHGLITSAGGRKMMLGGGGGGGGHHGGRWSDTIIMHIWQGFGITHEN